MQDTQEKVLYQGGPSQMLKLDVYLMCAVMLIVSLIAPALWKIIFVNLMPGALKAYFSITKLMFFVSIYWSIKAWLEIKTHKYKITTERFSETEGILSRTTHELELFRVRDITLSEPFSLRLVGCGDVILNTLDKTTPVVVLHGVKNARPVMEILPQKC